MDSVPFLLDPRRLWAGEGVPDGPLAVIDCTDAASGVRDWPDQLVLPPFPLIALGDRAHPLAMQCDTVVEEPVTLAGLVAQITAHPHTAAVIVDLLRLLPALDCAAGLIAESLAYGVVQAGAEHAAWRDSRPPAKPAPAGQVAIDRVGDRLDIVLARPHAGNAIDRPMRDELAVAFEVAALDPTLTEVRLTGQGRCFSLGADLAEFGTTREPAAAHDIRRRTLPARFLPGMAERLAVHVHGPCIGAGLEIAAFAGRITATENAWFQLPELAMGVLPGAGGCVSLIRRIGRQRAALMMLSGRRIPARIARDWGLVDALVDDLPTDESGANIA